MVFPCAHLTGPETSVVDEWQKLMREDYHAIVDGLSAEEREDLHAEWQQNLKAALDDEGKALSPATRLRRAQRCMLNAVCI